MIDESYNEENESLVEESKDENNTITQPLVEETEKKLQSATIHVKFVTNCDKINIVNKATQETNIVVSANKSLRLIQGRLYMIPVDINIDSDEYANIKQFSDTSDKFKICYVKDGFACIDPIQHNIQLTDGQKLCIIW